MSTAPARKRRGNGNGAATIPQLRPEPVARMSDLDEYRDAYRRFKSGEWDGDQWTAFRLRFGVYGQIQPGVQMVRIKIPGGILPVEWARTIARANRRFGGPTVHLTTRQDIQMYFVPLDDTPALLEELYGNGVTTREACGNTLRNMNGCALAGVCPREHIDAGEVSAQLARSWLRQPLVQHMPRKFKVAVSGCATDCASTGIHDLGFIAVEKDGRKGFRVFAGGGTGGVAIAAVEVLDFVTQEELPAVVEAVTRVHQRYSNRRNRNAARIKFVLKRFGEEKFRALIQEEFARVKQLPQRPWEQIAWREPEDAPEPASPGGVVEQHDGGFSVVVNPRLGLLSSDQLDALADIAEAHGVTEFRNTRDQNIAFIGLKRESVDEVVTAVRDLGFQVEDYVGDVPDVVACPGTTTCRIGITNSQDFARELLDLTEGYEAKPNVTVKISGCQNGCGLHHVADFGFRGMGKKIEGRHAPHYQIYIGGNPRQTGEIGLNGPIVPARYGRQALKLLMDGYAETRINGESVREWGLRLGKGGLKELLKPLSDSLDPSEKALYVDWGKTQGFTPPAVTHGDCAAGFAVDSLLADLADDGLITADRALLAGRREEALRAGREGFVLAARRLLLRLGLDDENRPEDETVAQVRSSYYGDPEIIEALDGVLESEAAAREGGDVSAYREALALWIDTVGETMKKPPAEPMDDLGAFDDSSSTVMQLVRQGQA